MPEPQPKSTRTSFSVMGWRWRKAVAVSLRRLGTKGAPKRAVMRNMPMMRREARVKIRSGVIWCVCRLVVGS